MWCVSNRWKMQSETLQEVYHFAKISAREQGLKQEESRHVLYGLVCVENEATPYLISFGLNRKELNPQTNFDTDPIRGEKEMQELNARTATIAATLGDVDTNCIHTLLAMLTMPQTYAYEKISFHLKVRGQQPRHLFNAIARDLPNGERLKNLGKPNTAPKTDILPHIEDVTSNDAYEMTVDAHETKKDERTIKYGIDLTERAANGGFDPVIGREMETERVIQTLTRRTKNNPILVGEAGVGKTAVVEGLAMCMASDNVPTELQGKRLIQLDMAAMVAGTRYRGDFEERLTKLVNQVVAEGDIILFIDEIHNMVGAGGTASGAMDAAEILKPALARGELHVIGATTTREYRLYIEKDPALERRFQPITVDEPSPQMAVEIVKGVKSKYEMHHGVQITDDAIETAVQLSVRYVTDRYLPDKAFDIIDEACSKLKITSYQHQATANNGQRVLTSEYVRMVVSQLTGVPVAELSRAEIDKLVHLEEELSSRVIGQSEAVKVVSRAVRRQRAGLKDPNRPIGSFIFVGPTGVGKTELAKALSDCLFGTNTEVIRIDMSEYMEKASVAKLIGAPPGYAGYDESGYLTEKVLRRPYSVVLFDEIEKAHPDVFNLLLQILDEGRLTDSHGKTIDFRNTVIILTSNIGITDVGNTTIGFISHSDYTAMQEGIDKALRKFFRPEFLNRLDEIVTFNYLGKAEMVRIAQQMCFALYNRLQGVVNLQFTKRAIEFLANDGYDRNYGARPLKRTIQRKVEDALAEQLLMGQINKGDNIRVDAVDNKIVFSKFTK